MPKPHAEYADTVISKLNQEKGTSAFDVAKKLYWLLFFESLRASNKCNKMLPLNCSFIYKTPEKYEPPDNLADDTNYPNLNSRDYAKRPLNHTTRMYEAWECISINSPDIEEDDGNVVIACNKLHGREWCGSLWGFEKRHVTNNKDLGKPSFKLQCDSLINCVEFVTKNILFLALNTGKVQVWSTYSEVRNDKNPYCLFLIGERCEHTKPVTSISTFETNECKALSGCKNGTVKIWDMGCADLFCQKSFQFAHSDVITGLAASLTDDNVFLTCSLDKSCLIWDDRETRPAFALYKNHNVRFKDVRWSVENKDCIIYLGDESGYILTIDKRSPNKYLDKSKYFDRPIRKIKPHRDNLAVIADKNIVKVSKIANHAVRYENSDSQHFIRDCIWLRSTELLTVGFDGKLRFHEVE
uniref:WD_REPEATS_REGION domain-containing protein n=1 Tax=Glossina brevipalpis TaxID=37001 RepID=A0A1A9W072_9MUSC